nr:uncharacterized protein LOC124489963 isoform X3 [Dermatophagoides farinae]
MNLLNHRYIGYIIIRNIDNIIWSSSSSSSSSMLSKYQNQFRKWPSNYHGDDQILFSNSHCSTSQFIKFSIPHQTFLNNYNYSSDTLKFKPTTTVFDIRSIRTLMNNNNSYLCSIIDFRRHYHLVRGHSTLSSSKTENDLVSCTHSSSNPPLTITIRLSISFSNGYFSVRFASRECLFHFWSPIELVLKMLQEELVSASHATAIHCMNIGSQTTIPFVDEHNDFLDQLLIEFDTQCNSGQSFPLRFDHIKFGRIEMVAEHLDNEMDDTSTSSENTSSSSSTDTESNTFNSESSHHQNQTTFRSSASSSAKHRYRLARLMPFGYALLGCDLDEIYFLGTGTGTIQATGPDGYRPHVERPLKIHFKLIDKTQKLKIDLEQWHHHNPLDAQTMLFKSKTIDPNLFEQNELVFLQQEHQSLLERFQPLQQEFTELIDSARKESRRRFKFGGLFLLSAQLGFVGRLTYFEYSWDIMEPVTWIMTYTTMIICILYNNIGRICCTRCRKTYDSIEILEIG